jgi:hypothetical protein
MVLRYNEEVHKSKILREWSDMISYEMGNPSTGIYTMAKTSSAGTFKHQWKNDMVANMATIYVGRILLRSSFLDNLKPLDKKLGLKKTPTWGIF